jgi:hypothetical protein
MIRMPDAVDLLLRSYDEIPQAINSGPPFCKQVQAHGNYNVN